MLRQRHLPQEWATFVELRNGTGAIHPVRSIDFFAINTWPSKKYWRVAYEKWSIAVFRSKLPASILLGHVVGNVTPNGNRQTIELNEYGAWIGEGKPELDSVNGRVECGYYCDPVVGHVDHRAHIMKRVGKKTAGRFLGGVEYGHSSHQRRSVEQENRRR